MADSRLSLMRHGLLPSGRSTKRLITDMAEEAGLVYFGYVSQRDDEHHIVRGMTVSTKHRDDHYCIGTYEDYDVVFVERSDSLRNGKKHAWHVVEFDLKTHADIPHIFIGSGRQGHGFHELLDTKYPSLKAIEPGSTAQYPPDFLSRFNIYTTPAHTVAAERLITPAVATIIASHFSGLAVEITEQALYIYSEKLHVSKHLLSTMLKNGAWLAAKLDENSRQL